jgi:hypothetical protein
MTRGECGEHPIAASGPSGPEPQNDDVTFVTPIGFLIDTVEAPPLVAN